MSMNGSKKVGVSWKGSIRETPVKLQEGKEEGSQISEPQIEGGTLLSLMQM
jgi:hypothetical protein